jgi:hypothetical protein
MKFHYFMLFAITVICNFSFKLLTILEVINKGLVLYGKLFLELNACQEASLFVNSME